MEQLTLKSVRSLLFAIKKKWYSIGVELELSADELDAIKASSSDHGECLMEMIKIWLKSTNPPPTWKALSDALNSDPIDEKELGETALTKHNSSSGGQTTPPPTNAEAIAMSVTKVAEQTEAPGIVSNGDEAGAAALMLHHGVTEEACNRIISDQHIQSISQSLCKKWWFLLPHLNLPNIWADDIEREYSKEEERRYRFLCKWKLKKMSAATYRALLSALLKIKCRDEAGKLCKILKHSPSTAETPTHTVESPYYDKKAQSEHYHDQKPIDPPGLGTVKYRKLHTFCKEVDIILHTSHFNDYQAAVTFMKPPTSDFTRSVIFPMNFLVVGIFAGHKAALILDKASNTNDEVVRKAIQQFPNAKFIIAVGSCFAFDGAVHKLGDVVVSEKIGDISNLKLDKGRIENRGQIVSTASELNAIFCIGVEHASDVMVTENRKSKVYEGIITSHPSQIDDKDVRTAIRNTISGAVGGDMDGWKLLGLVNAGLLKGVIVIKGVADNGSPSVAEDWQFTASKAALHYVKSRLAQCIHFPPGSDYSMALSSSYCSDGTISITGSKYQEPVKLRERFPYLKLHDNSEEEIEQRYLRLSRRTDDMKRRFQSLVMKFKKFVHERCDLEVVIDVLRDYDRNKYQALLSDCKTLHELFERIRGYYSFYDFTVVKVLIKNLGSDSNKKDLQKYKSAFREYWEKRICEIPSDAFVEAPESEKFRVKIEGNITEIEGNNIEVLKFEMRRILGHELQFLYVKDGCVEVVFRSYEPVSELSKEQQSEMKRFGILSVSYGDFLMKFDSDDSSFIEARESVKNKDMGFYSDSEEVSDIGHETESEELESELYTSQPSKSFTPNKVRDLRDPRLDLITSAITFNMPELILEKLDVDINAMKLVEAKKHLISDLTPLCLAVSEENVSEVKRLIAEGENPYNQDVNGDTVLHYAAESGKLEILKYLIDEYECIATTEGWHGSTILHSAAAANQLPVMKYLIEKCQLDPSSLEDNYCCSPLVYACRSGDIETCCYLIKSMQETMSLSDIFEVKFYSKPSTELIPKTVDAIEFQRGALLSACYCGHLPLVKYLVEECSCDFSSTEISQTLDASLYLRVRMPTPLQSAVLGNHLDIVKYLVDKMKDSTIAVSDKNTFLLHYAALNSNLEMIQYLIQNSLCKIDQLFNEISPLHIAAQYGSIEIIKYLIDEFQLDPEMKGQQNKLPIHYAASKGNLHVVEFLVKEKSCDSSVLDEKKYMPLHYAAAYGHLTTVDFLVNKLEPSSDSKFDTETPLHLAAAKGQMEVVKYLITDKKFDPHAQGGEHGVTALHSATNGGHLDVTKYLIEEQDCKVNDEPYVAAQFGYLDVLKYFIHERNFDPGVADAEGYSLVHHAAVGGEVAILEYLIEDLSCSCSDTDLVGFTPLHLAAGKGQIDAVKYLVAKKCDPNTPGAKGYTPLHYAAQNGHLNVVRYLVKELSCKPDHNITELNIAPIHLASCEGKLDIVQFLIDEVNCDANSPDKDNYAPIHYAAQNGHLKIIKYLADENKCNLNSKATNNVLPLHIAIAHGHTDIVRYLMVEKRCDSPHYPSVHRAAKGGHLELVKFLVEELKYNADGRDESKRTPMMHAAHAGRLEVVKYLACEAKCDPESRDRHGLSPIHYAAQEGHLPVLIYLTTEPRSNIHAKTAYNDTPLHFAAFEGQLDVVKYLTKELKCDPNIAGDSDNKPIHLAAKNGKLSIIKYLVEELGCDASSRGQDNFTPLSLASEFGQFEVTQYLVGKIEDVNPIFAAASRGDLELLQRIISERNIDPDVSDETGDKAIHYATYSGRIHIIKYLIEKLHCNPDSIGNSSYRPLCIAVMTGHLDIVKYLVEEQKCTIDIMDGENVPPLLFAALHDRLNIVRYFVSRGTCNIYASIEQGITIAHAAAEKGDLSLLKYLHDEVKYDFHYNKGTQYGEVPLHTAASAGERNVVDYLINEVKCSPVLPDFRGLTPLHYAVQRNRQNIVEYLLNNHNCDVNIRTLAQSTPLHLAAMDGYITLVRYLIANPNCIINPISSEGCTPLHLAASRGHLEVVKHFVDQLNCDPDHRVEVMNSSSLHLAILSGHMDIVKYLIAEKKCDPNSTGQNDFKAVHYATNGGHAHILEYLVEELKCDCNSTATQNITPLHIAVQQGNFDLACFLVSKLKCDYKKLDLSGLSPFHYAAENGDLRTMHYFVEELNYDGRDGDSLSCTPLHLAAFEGHLKAVQYLVTQRKYDPTKTDEKGLTPVHYAAQGGRLSVVKYLVTELNCNINVKSFSNLTPLHLAAHQGRLKMVQYLVSELHCDPTHPGSKSLTTIHIAAKRGHLDILKYLVSQCRCNANIRSSSNVTPLHLAAKNGHLNVVQYLIIDLNCDPNARDKQELTALHYAAKGGSLDMVRYFVKELNCDPHLKAMNTTTLHLASSKGHLDVVKYLTSELKCDPTIAGDNGFTAMHLAAEKGHLNIVKFLITEFTANITLSESNYTPLQVAARNGHLDVVKYLYTIVAYNSTDDDMETAERKSASEMIDVLYEHASSVKKSITKLLQHKLEAKFNADMEDIAFSTYSLIHITIAAEENLVTDSKQVTDSKLEPDVKLLSIIESVVTNLAVLCDCAMGGQLKETSATETMSSFIAELLVYFGGKKIPNFDTLKATGDGIQTAVLKLVAASSKETTSMQCCNKEADDNLSEMNIQSPVEEASGFQDT